jgi:LemA protein
VIFAGLMGFRQQVFFDVGEIQRQALEAPPKVAF